MTMIGKPIAHVGRYVVNAGATRTGRTIANFGRKVAVGGPMTKYVNNKLARRR